MGLINHGKIQAHNNGLDGIHIGQGGDVKNFGDIVSHDNIRHGVFVAEDIATLKEKIDEASALLDKEELQTLRGDLMPLLVRVKHELNAPQPNVSVVQTALSSVKSFLLKHGQGVAQGIVGNMIFAQIPAFGQLHNLIEAGMLLLP